MLSFRSFRKSCPVVQIGHTKSSSCVFALSLGGNEYFVFRDVFARVEVGHSGEVVPVLKKRGVHGILRCIVEREMSIPYDPRKHSLRLPSFTEWWDGTNDQLVRLMRRLLEGLLEGRDFEDAIVNAARAITSSTSADLVIQEQRFPASARFAVIHRTETELSIRSLCAYVNAHSNSARELRVRLEHASPLIRILARWGELERIRPAMEYVPKVFEWWNTYGNRKEITDALATLAVRTS